MTGKARVMIMVKVEVTVKLKVWVTGRIKGEKNG